MATYIKVNNIEYPAIITGVLKDREWSEREVKAWIDEVKDGPVKRRLVALLWLLLLEGLRRDEVASTSWRQIENMRIDGRDTDHWNTCRCGRVSHSGHAHRYWLHIRQHGNRARGGAVHGDTQR